MRTALTILFLVFGFHGFGEQGLHPVLVKEVRVGSETGEIGFNTVQEGGIFPSPYVAFFTPEGLVGVLDAFNLRTEFFDPETLDFKSEVRSNYSRIGSLFEVTAVYQDAGFYWGRGNRSTYLIDASMRAILQLPALGRTFFKAAVLWSFGRSGDVIGYDLQGKKIDGGALLELMKKLNPTAYAGTAYSPTIDAALRGMIEGGRYVIVGGKILPKDFKQARDFYNLFAGTKWRDGRKDLSGEAPFKVADGYYENWGLAEDGTTYWKFSGDKPQTTYVGVLSPFGDLLAYFSLNEIEPKLIRQQVIASGKIPDFGEGEYNAPRMVISPQGHIYLMVGYPKVIKFYRVKRTW